MLHRSQAGHGPRPVEREQSMRFSTDRSGGTNSPSHPRVFWGVVVSELYMQLKATVLRSLPDSGASRVLIGSASGTRCFPHRRSFPSLPPSEHFLRNDSLPRSSCGCLWQRHGGHGLPAAFLIEANFELVPPPDSRAARHHITMNKNIHSLAVDPQITEILLPAPSR